MPDSAERIRLGKAAWVRLKRDSQRSWDDWILVGQALLEGRAITMRDARTGRPITAGYMAAFHAWLIDNRFNLPPNDRAQLLALMGKLPAVEAWRATLPETQRQRLNHPSTVLRVYREASGIKLNVMPSSTHHHDGLPAGS